MLKPSEHLVHDTLAYSMQGCHNVVQHIRHTHTRCLLKMYGLYTYYTLCVCAWCLYSHTAVNTIIHYWACNSFPWFISNQVRQAWFMSNNVSLFAFVLCFFFLYIFCFLFQRRRHGTSWPITMYMCNCEFKSIKMETIPILLCSQFYFNVCLLLCSLYTIEAYTHTHTQTSLSKNIMLL